jgi:hypothetical protein
MMVRGSTLLTVKISPLSMFLNMSPTFIMVFPLLKKVRVRSVPLSPALSEYPLPPSLHIKTRLSN